MKMKHLECKPCKYFTIKPKMKRKTQCSLNDDGAGDIEIKKIIWCKEFEDRNQGE